MGQFLLLRINPTEIIITKWEFPYKSCARFIIWGDLMKKWPLKDYLSIFMKTRSPACWVRMELEKPPQCKIVHYSFLCNLALTVY